MGFEDNLKLERYKLVTNRQKYFTELTRDVFASYMKIFTALAVAGIALVSAKSQLSIHPKLLFPLLNGILWLITFLGISAIGQIIFCLCRWEGYRKAEIEINPLSPEIKRWWWIFEGLYCLAIVISIISVWCISSNISSIIQELSKVPK